MSWLNSIIEDIRTSPRTETQREVPLEMSTATFHRLPEHLQEFLRVRAISHRPTWETQGFTLTERDHDEFLRMVRVASELAAVLEPAGEVAHG